MKISTECTDKMKGLHRMMEKARERANGKGRPLITLTYAQSLDGSISGINKEPLAISGEESFRMTHELRAIHDAILIGIGTVLSDNPMLTVRLAEGDNPSPVILDTNQRITPESRMFRENGRAFYIVSAGSCKTKYSAFFREVGANVIHCPTNSEGLIDLYSLMPKLHALGIESIMVEGGAKVISSFLSARLADILLLTISPRLIGGYNALFYYRDMGVRVKEGTYDLLGQDLVFWGYPDWERG